MNASTLHPGSAQHLEAYDDPVLQRQFTESLGNGLKRATLLLEGVSCAGCVRLIESRLEATPGIVSSVVNATTHRAEVCWDETLTAPSRFIQVIYDLGYAAYPFDAHHRQNVLADERKALLKRLAIGALCGMQIMMFALALYSGAWHGMSPGVERLLRWASLLLAVPIVSYSAEPFFRGAWRALGNRELSMDVPVSIALALAFVASASATLTGAGAVYFESIAMFVVLLLASRYLELGARIKATAQFDDLARVIPQMATRISAAGYLKSLPLGAFDIGDLVLVKAGEVIPFDGTVVAGCSAVDESILSGESAPQAKQRHAHVIGGSINIDSPLEIRIERRVGDAFIAEVSRLAQNAQAHKPRLTRLANRLARWFILGVLSIAAAVALYWYIVDPVRVIPTTIAILVITCPCALALATPVALVAASGALMRAGIVAVNPEVIETLARAQTFIFDKTGTLTTGELRLSRVVEDGHTHAPGAIAAALCAHSEHSIARAVQRLGSGAARRATALENFPGRGIAGEVDGVRYWFGSAQFVADEAGAAIPRDMSARLRRNEKTGFLARRDHLVAAWQFHDEIKPGARELIDALKLEGFKVAMLTGDTESVALELAGVLGIDDVRAARKPAEKLAELERRQRSGEVCVVIGDGVNDAPMIAHGFVSVAVGNACDLAKNSADLVLINDRLSGVLRAYRTSRQTLRIIRQNVAWAIGYNVCALPLAIAGMVPPWIAALGMSLSSLIVVANAARINRGS